MRHSLGYDYGIFLCGATYSAPDNLVTSEGDDHIHCVVCADMWRNMPHETKVAYNLIWIAQGLMDA